MKKRPHLFVVDDTAGDVSLLKQGFADCGVEVDITDVREGDAAIARLDGDSSLFDLVLIDYYLPKKTGDEVIRTVRERGRFPRCPVVMLSSQLPAAQRRDMIQAGVQVLDKPGDLEGYAHLARRLLALIDGSAV